MADEWDDIGDEYGFNFGEIWDDIESVHVIRGDDGWDIAFEVDGETIYVDGNFSDDEFQSLFWDDLYYDLIEDEIDVDREIEYGEAN